VHPAFKEGAFVESAAVLLQIDPGMDALGEAVDLVPGRTCSVIHRADRKRVVAVNCDLDEQLANARKIVTDLGVQFLPDQIRRYPDVSAVPCPLIYSLSMTGSFRISAMALEADSAAPGNVSASARM